MLRKLLILLGSSVLGIARVMLEVGHLLRGSRLSCGAELVFA